VAEQSIICTRAFEFAARIVKVSEKLWHSRPPGGRHIAVQLLESATSIGANAEEAQDAQTKPDYIAKMSVSRKEAREAGYWLRFAVRTELVQPSEIEWEQRECRELLQMIRAAIRTAQSSSRRNTPQP
jgi:four helix bundle protein